MPLHPPFWNPFKKHGGHVQSNTSISETKRRRAFNFDSMSRFCGAYTCRKSIVSYVSVLGINHFDVYGGHFIKWWPFPWIMSFISATKRDVTTILIYSCIFWSCSTEKKLLRFAQSRCAHHAGGILFEYGRPFPDYYPIVKKLYVFMFNTSFKLRILM